MTTLRLLSPLSGWCAPLADVPDPVFAEGLAGDGVAIDPTEGRVVAPCDGVVRLVSEHRHALTIVRDGVEIVVHVGIDTVALHGEGFDLKVSDGAKVRAGDVMLEFDLDLLARKAPSVLTPVLVASGGRIASRRVEMFVAAGEPLLEIAVGDVVAPEAAGDGTSHRASVGVPFDHGLHVRPAAKVVAALRAFDAQVQVHGRGRTANARSTVAMMALGARRGDVIEIVATGPDAAAALAAMQALFAAAPEQVPAPVIAEQPAAATGRVVATIASRGEAEGPAMQWIVSDVPVEERSRGRPAEIAALDAALSIVRAHLEVQAAAAGGEQRALLQGHLALLDDVELRDFARDEIEAGRSAGLAWKSAVADACATLRALDDARMRERVADLGDLEQQVLRVLAGRPPGSTREFSAGTIVLAQDLVPSQFMALERQRVGGIVLAVGGATSHVAILAAAAGIPLLVGAGAGVLGIRDGTPVVLDALEGWLDVDPPLAERRLRGAAMAMRTEQRAHDAANARQPALTRDGVRISLLANLASADEVPNALRDGAEGCGLLRTEFLFLDRSDPPGEEEQLQEYDRIVAAMDGRPVSIRTMDVGGDKPIAYLPMPREDNPALGLRGIRASLREPALLRTQLRAMVRVAGAVRLLLPMVTDVAEIHAVRTVLVEAALQARRPVPPLGVMIETPASALLASSLAPHVEFFSIGTNDLAQYTLAMDRGHAELAPRLDALHPAVLQLVARVVECARPAGLSVSICGALASDAQALPVLVGLGVRELSASPGAIPALKRVARGLAIAECETLAQRALAAATAAEVRSLAARFHQDIATAATGG